MCTRRRRRLTRQAIEQKDHSRSVALDLFRPRLFDPRDENEIKGRTGKKRLRKRKKSSPSGVDLEDVVHGPLLDGGYRPGDANTQEDVDGVAARHVTDGSVGVLILDSGHFAGERVCQIRQQIEEGRAGQGGEGEGR